MKVHLDQEACPQCRVPDPAFGRLGPLAIVRGDERTSLRALFLGRLDRHECPSCGVESGLVPTVMVRDGVRAQLSIAWGNRPAASPIVRREILAAIDLSNSVERVELSNLAELIRRTAQREAMLLERLIGIAREAARDAAPLLKEGWVSLSSAYFAAAALAFTTKLPGVQLGLHDPVELQIVADVVARLQATVWLALCRSWAEPVEGRTLELALERFVAPDAILPAASTYFLDAIEDLDWRSEAQQLCAEAIRAWLCVLRGRANGHRRELVDLIVRSEVGAAGLRSMTLSGERVLQLASHGELTDACRRVLRDRPNLAPAIDQLGDKLGHPKLGSQLRTPRISVPPEERSIASVRAALQPS